MYFRNKTNIIVGMLLYSHINTLVLCLRTYWCQVTRFLCVIYSNILQTKYIHIKRLICSRVHECVLCCRSPEGGEERPCPSVLSSSNSLLLCLCFHFLLLFSSRMDKDQVPLACVEERMHQYLIQNELFIVSVSVEKCYEVYPI